MSIEMYEVVYDKQIRDVESFTSSLKFQAKAEYYHLNAGFWEPFIEHIDITVMFDKSALQSIV
jgi:hypothetical protein